MQKFEQVVSYIENGEAEKGLQLLKEQLKLQMMKRSMISLVTIIHLDLQMRH